jgi:hypothetical protein
MTPRIRPVSAQFFTSETEHTVSFEIRDNRDEAVGRVAVVTRRAADWQATFELAYGNLVSILERALADAREEQARMERKTARSAFPTFTPR